MKFVLQLENNTIPHIIIIYYLLCCRKLWNNKKRMNFCRSHWTLNPMTWTYDRDTNSFTSNCHSIRLQKNMYLINYWKLYLEVFFIRVRIRVSYCGCPKKKSMLLLLKAELTFRQKCVSCAIAAMSAKKKKLKYALGNFICYMVYGKLLTSYYNNQQRLLKLIKDINERHNTRGTAITTH